MNSPDRPDATPERPAISVELLQALEDPAVRRAVAQLLLPALDAVQEEENLNASRAAVSYQADCAADRVPLHVQTAARIVGG